MNPSRFILFACLQLILIGASCAAAAPDDPSPFGPVSSSGLHWLHFSSANGDLPIPGESTEQTGCIVADLDADGRSDFIVSFRQTAPALVWYRRTDKGWDRYVLEKEFLT